MSARPERMHEVQLRGGKVLLPEWQDLAPPVHGPKLQNAAYNPRTGDRPQFYEATAEWMRNSQAQRTMHSAPASVHGQDILLFYFDKTKTWHSSDALDIDHKTRWRDHLVDKGVNNRADAMRAYNDVKNLRMVPSFYNRARESADRVLNDKGADSPEWRNWVQSRIGFDPSANPAPFDPERDLARRTKATTGQPWTDEHTRSDLSFDTKVVGKWFEHALAEAYVDSVKMRNPETGGVDEVPLFRCAASRQLTTRDALDIDHAIPYEIIADKMREIFPNHVITKADMLDVYNDTSNLRLVTRGANSSHEFEMDPHGRWRDTDVPARPQEFKGWLEKGPALDEAARALIRDHFTRSEARLPAPAEDRIVTYMIPHHAGEVNLMPGTPHARAGADAPLNAPDSPYRATYDKVSGAVERLVANDPKFYDAMRYFNNGHPPPNGHVETIATTLMAAAKERGLTQIDGIVTDPKRHTLFVFQGDPRSDSGIHIDVPLRAAMKFTVEENTQRVQHVDQRTMQTQQGMPMPFDQPHPGRHQ